MKSILYIVQSLPLSREKKETVTELERMGAEVKVVPLGGAVVGFRADAIHFDHVTLTKLDDILWMQNAMCKLAPQ